MLPEAAHHFKGVELVDSFDTNPHKWLLTNFDCSTLFVKDATYVKLALTLNPAFLINKTNEYDYKVIYLRSFAKQQTLFLETFWLWCRIAFK